MMPTVREAPSACKDFLLGPALFGAGGKAGTNGGAKPRALLEKPLHPPPPAGSLWARAGPGVREGALRESILFQRERAPEARPFRRNGRRRVGRRGFPGVAGR